MRISKAPGSRQHCTNCNQDVDLDLIIPGDHDPTDQIHAWTWACTGCGTRINQKVTGEDPFMVATEVVKSRVKA
jgi:hypothetical protein